MRKHMQRRSSFGVLRNDTNLHKHVGRHDKGFLPNMEQTLSYTLQLEMNYGTKNDLKSFTFARAKHVPVLQYKTETAKDCVCNQLPKIQQLKNVKFPSILDLRKQTYEVVKLLTKNLPSMHQRPVTV